MAHIHWYRAVGKHSRRICQWVWDQSALFSELWKDKLQHSEVPKATANRGGGRKQRCYAAGKALTVEASDLSLDPQHWQQSPVWGWVCTCHLNSEVQGCWQTRQWEWPYLQSKAESQGGRHRTLTFGLHTYKPVYMCTYTFRQWMGRVGGIGVSH